MKTHPLWKRGPPGHRLVDLCARDYCGTSRMHAHRPISVLTNDVIEQFLGFLPTALKLLARSRQSFTGGKWLYTIWLSLAPLTLTSACEQIPEHAQRRPEFSPPTAVPFWGMAPDNLGDPPPYTCAALPAARRGCSWSEAVPRLSPEHLAIAPCGRWPSLERPALSPSSPQRSSSRCAHPRGEVTKGHVQWRRWFWAHIDHNSH